MKPCVYCTPVAVNSAQPTPSKGNWPLSRRRSFYRKPSWAFMRNIKPFKKKYFHQQLVWPFIIKPKTFPQTNLSEMKRNHVLISSLTTPWYWSIGIILYRYIVIQQYILQIIRMLQKFFSCWNWLIIVCLRKVGAGSACRLSVPLHFGSKVIVGFWSSPRF